MLSIIGNYLETGEHDLLPGLARRRAEEHEDGLEERLEVVVAVDLGALLRRDLAEHLEEIVRRREICWWFGGFGTARMQFQINAINLGL